jgi:hypothetical protein
MMDCKTLKTLIEIDLKVSVDDPGKVDEPSFRQWVGSSISLFHLTRDELCSESCFQIYDFLLIFLHT